MRLMFFKPDEFACRCCGQVHMDRAFLLRLDESRGMAGIPYVITSGYRCAKHNAAVGGSPTSSHLHGIAADIAAPDSHTAFLMMQSLIFTGFKRIGWNQARRFIHVDTDPDKPQRVLFSY